MSLANGKLVGRSTQSSSTTLLSHSSSLFPSLLPAKSPVEETIKTIYELGYPLKASSYLLCVAVGPFIHVCDDQPVLIRDGKLDTEAMYPISYYALPTRKGRDIVEKEVWRAFGRTPRMIKWLQQKLGTNPLNFIHHF